MVKNDVQMVNFVNKLPFHRIILLVGGFDAVPCNGQE